MISRGPFLILPNQTCNIQESNPMQQQSVEYSQE